jgi:ABC-type phosphate transport system substrate-binding protein
MRKVMLVAAALTAGVVGLNETAAAAEDMKVTGTVTEADKTTNEITIGDKTFVMPEEAGGASMFPQVGAEVTVSYEEQDDQNVITRIGHAQE